MTVLDRRIVSSIVLVMTWITHIVGAKAAEKGRGTTIHALPVNLVGTMLVTLSRPRTDLFEKAILTHEIFFLRVSLLLVSHLILAVD